MRVGHRRSQDGEVELAVEQRFVQLRRHGFAYVQPNGRVGLTVLLDEWAGHERAHRGGHAEREAASGLVLGHIEADAQAAQQVDDLFGPPSELAPGGGELDAARVTPQQANADLALDFLVLTAQHRLRHVERVGRARKAARLGDRQEVSKLAEIEVHIVCSGCGMTKRMQAGIANHAEIGKETTMAKRNTARPIGDAASIKVTSGER